jgi:hypothetical protein
MFRIGTRRAFLAVLSGAIVLAATTPARADNIIMNIQEDSGSVKTISGTNSVNFNGTWADFTIGSAFGNKNQGTFKSLTQQGAFSVTNNDSVKHTLHISVTGLDFTSPNSPPPLLVLDTVSGSLLNGHVKGTFQGFADALNTAFGTGFASSLLSFDVSGLSQSFSANGAKAGFSPNGAAYSLTLFIDIEFDAGTSITVDGGNVQTVVPAPAGIVLILAGMPFVGLGCFLRRRRPVQVPA